MTPTLIKHESPGGPYWYHPDHPDCQDGKVLWEEPSDTPLTDAAMLPEGEYKGHLVWADFAYTLERKLNAASEIIRRLAEWSEKYPRQQVHSFSAKVDEQLIEIENAAKVWLGGHNVRESDTTRRTTQTMSTENQTPANPKPSPAGQCGSLSVIAGSESVACAATPRDELLRQILDSRIPKNEREWCAAREIEELRKGLAAALALIEDSYGVAGLHLNGDVAPWHELRTGGRYEDWLFDFDQAVKRLPPNKD